MKLMHLEKKINRDGKLVSELGDNYSITMARNNRKAGPEIAKETCSRGPNYARLPARTHYSGVSFFRVNRGVRFPIRYSELDALICIKVSSHE
ncbi:uncharacterized protein LOC143149535 [Ptiloglossa arizonensis]|uniref:uncharacterized protein LOC143149535 n=1 Tax=Ptiloglossa arizonensis TaxID=3350558 RepID=UPI003FA196A4